VVLERYGGKGGAGIPHALYSGTKSFWGVLAVAAEDDGLLELDEPVAQTIAQWRDEAWKRRVTLRQLLNLTSGLPFGGLGRAVPLYADALATPLRHEPGTAFTYGGIPLQVFGAVLARKLAHRGLSAHAFLRERILDRIGVGVAAWRNLRDGTQPLPTGAFLEAGQWLQYGRFLLRRGRAPDGTVVVREESLGRCFAGSAVNARYGAGFWLHRTKAGLSAAYASGSGGQALYVVPQRGIAVVRFAAGGSYKHEAFLNRLLD
jgi:CubicO group peptidase (beta-lactamase class C family)